VSGTPWVSYWSQIAQMLTPAVAVAGFWFINRQIDVAKEQAEAGKDAAIAAKEQASATIETLKHFRETSKPRVVITPHFFCQGGSDGLVLVVKNFGSALTICHHLTLRKDVRVDAAFGLVKSWNGVERKTTEPEEEVRIIDTIVEASGVISFFLPLDSQFSRPSSGESHHSSISLYYGDGMDNYFVSRVHYIWKNENEKTVVEVAGREHEDIKELPVNSHSPSNIQVYLEPEGSTLPIDVPFLRVLHLSRTAERIRHMEVDGCDETGNLPIKIVGYKFEWDGWPIITARISGKPTWSLARVNDSGRSKIRISDTGTATVHELGLVFPVQEEDLAKNRLYGHVISWMIGSSMTELQRTYPVYFPF